jgi:hypothetical protein
MNRDDEKIMEFVQHFEDFSNDIKADSTPSKKSIYYSFLTI